MLRSSAANASRDHPPSAPRDADLDRDLHRLPLASLGLILVALIALPLAVVLLALAVLLVVLLAAVIMVAAGIRRIAAPFTRIDPGGPGGADAEGRVNVRVRRPDA